MSSGQTHDKVTILLAPIIFGVFWYFIGWLAIIVTLAFLFAGFAFNGDLDINSQVYNRWFLLKWIWIPYQQFGHRSFWTHGILIGTVIRVLWLAIPTISILTLCGLSPSIIPFMATFKTETILSLIGLELGSMSHTFMDWASTGFKKLFN